MPSDCERPRVPDVGASTRRLPDFIIGGAAKSGSSTLHELLDRQPGVFLPPQEIYLFSIDDFEQHPEFAVSKDGGWTDRDFERNAEEFLDWYASFFVDAPPEAILGEDSTTYLPARHAAERIRRELPDVKLIFVLRDPAARTYSQYWHDLRVGRVTEGFEATLRHSAGTLIGRSLYAKQVQRYTERFPAAQLKFLLFEELIADPTAAVRGVCDFLDIRLADDYAADLVHRNPARMPRSIRLQFLRNRLFRDRVHQRFRGHLPWTEQSSSVADRVVRSRWARLNLDAGRRPPPMRPDTHEFLDALFQRENGALPELIGLDVERHWYRSRAPREAGGVIERSGRR